MAAGSLKVVIAAFVGNGLIAITKFAAAAYTGSSAMLSEGIHSLVDTGNQALLWHGMRRSSKPADKRHPFGYGMEMYFWAFVVAVLIFSIGAGVSLYEGYEKILHPTEITSPHINYIVLGVAMIFEGGASYVAVKEFLKTKGDKSVLQAIRSSKDAVVFTVLLEDSAALLGLIVAFVGIFLGQLWDMPVLDGVASMVIGVILALTAVFLAYESKSLLLGEGADQRVIDGVTDIVGKHDGISAINEVLSMHMSPNDVLLTLSLDFAENLSSDQVEQAITALEEEIKQAFPEMKRIFIEAQSISAHKRLQQTAAVDNN